MGGATGPARGGGFTLQVLLELLVAGAASSTIFSFTLPMGLQVLLVHWRFCELLRTNSTLATTTCSGAAVVRRSCLYSLSLTFSFFRCFASVAIDLLLSGRLQRDFAWAPRMTSGKRCCRLAPSTMRLAPIAAGKALHHESAREAVDEDAQMRAGQRSQLKQGQSHQRTMAEVTGRSSVVPRRWPMRGRKQRSAREECRQN
jgi:hypothetical protein